MVSFTLNEKTYVTPSGWHEVTVKQFIKYIDTVQKFQPEALTQVMESEDIEQAYSELQGQDKVDVLEYFAKCLSFWTGAPFKDIQEMSVSQLEQAFWTIEVDFANVDYQEDFCGFNIEGVEYLLPKRHMIESTLGEFVEAAQFQDALAHIEGGEWKALLDVMCVLCRPVDEVYDNKRNIGRKRIFEKVTMDVVLNVSFFLFRLNLIFKHNFQIFLIKQALNQQVKEE